MKERIRKTQNEKGNKAITLIALVITIVVLLILAGTSIAMLSGENGIIKQTIKAEDANIVGKEKEYIKMAYMTIKSIEMNDVITETHLQEELEKYTGAGNVEVTDNNDGTLNVKFYESNNHYTVNKGNVEQTAAKITNKKIVLNSSSQEIIFNNTITQNDIDSISGKKGTNYEIIGIASEENGEYTTKAVGKTGELTIEGDAKNATFKYELTDFMQGDETFFVKYKIDGVEQEEQKLNVIQANAITYQEDFAKIIYEAEEPSTWELVTDENFSDGKAMRLTCLSSTSFAKFDFTGSAMQFITMAEKDKASILEFIIRDTEQNVKVRLPGTLDIQMDIEYNIRYPYINLTTNDTYNLELNTIPVYDFENWDREKEEAPQLLTTYAYFDAVVIYK